MDDKKYFSRAWGLLTRDKGWIKPVLVMTAAKLVPVAGPLGNSGYALEWARLSAWGVDASPKQKNVDIGACIKSGWRAFLVTVGWVMVCGVAVSLVSLVANSLPGQLGNLVAGIVGMAEAVAWAFVGVVVLVAQIRAAIYEKAAAGYRPDRVFEMIGRDFEGFAKVFLINLGFTAVIGIVGTVMGVALFFELTPVFMMAPFGHVDTAYVLQALAASMGWVALTCALFGSVISLIGTVSSLVTSTAAGLWMRQFNVPAWGRSEDPLP